MTARRRFLALASAALAVPLLVRAQPLPPLRLLGAHGVPPLRLLDAFAAERGRAVERREVGAQTEALAGLADCDLAILGDGALAAARAEGLLQALPVAAPLTVAEPLLAPCRADTALVALPWAWGRLGFAYDPRVGEPPSADWAGFWAAAAGAFRGRALLPDDAGQAMGLGLRALGEAWGATEEAALAAAGDWLLARRDLLFAVTADPLPALASGDAALSPLWSSDLPALRAHAPQLRFLQPADESLLWLDVLAIPAATGDAAGAAALLDWLAAPAQAAAAAEEGTQAPADAAAWQRLSPAVREVLPGGGALAASRLADPAWAADGARLAMLERLKGG